MNHEEINGLPAAQLGADLTSTSTRSLTLNVYYAALFLFIFRKCAILISRGIVNRSNLIRFSNRCPLTAAELELAATSAITLSTSTTMRAPLYHDLGNVAGRI